MRKRSCLVLGCGRGGTSLVAGMIVHAGYYAGDNLHTATDANPNGFYEDAEVNRINEQLLTPLFPTGMRLGHTLWRSGRLADSYQRWLTEMSPDARLPEPSDELRERMRAHAARQPFCLKDPRFCYTLDAWRPYLDGAAFVCVFREPTVSAKSMVKEAQSARYLASIRRVVTESYALSVWTSMFQHVLGRHRSQGDWIFIHYEQLFDTAHVRRLEDFLGTTLRHDFADRRLTRTPSDGTPSDTAASVYRELCELASYAV